MDLITKYGFIFGTRYYKSQKLRFSEEIKKDFENSKVNYQVVSDHFIKNNHIHINKNVKAKYALLSSYDTKSASLSKNYRYYPLNETKALNQERKLLIKNILISLVLFFLSILMFVTTDYLVVKILAAIALIIGIFIITGIPNKINMNLNSMSVILLLTILQNYEKTKVVLYDQDIKSVSKHLGGSTPIIIGTIARGDNFYVYHKGVNTDVDKLVNGLKTSGIDVSVSNSKTKYSDLFEEYIYITSAENDGEDIYVSGVRSNSDKILNSNFLEVIYSSLLEVV